MALGSSIRPKSREDSARERLSRTARSVQREASRRARNDRRDDDDDRRSSASSSSTPEAPKQPKPNTRGMSSGNTNALDRLLSERARKGGSFRSNVLSNLYGIPEDGPRASRALQDFNGRQKRTILGR